MKAKILKALTLVTKITGFLGSFGVIPFIDPGTAAAVFMAASIVKDVANRIGDFLDDGVANKSFD